MNAGLECELLGFEPGGMYSLMALGTASTVRDYGPSAPLVEDSLSSCEAVTVVLNAADSVSRCDADLYLLTSRSEKSWCHRISAEIDRSSTLEQFLE